jgi:hypothetical protein
MRKINGKKLRRWEGEKMEDGRGTREDGRGKMDEERGTIEMGW